MKRAADHSKKAKQVFVPLIGAALMAYFAYHAVQGDRGLLAWWQLRYQMEVLESKLLGVRETKEKLEHQISLIRPESLDLDMIDERARTVLAFLPPDELLVIPSE